VIVISVHDEECVRHEVMEADAFVLKRAIATDLLAVFARLRDGGVTASLNGKGTAAVKSSRSWK
jgi:hypothetical protein